VLVRSVGRGGVEAPAFRLSGLCTLFRTVLVAVSIAITSVPTAFALLPSGVTATA